MWRCGSRSEAAAACARRWLTWRRGSTWQEADCCERDLLPLLRPAERGPLGCLRPLRANLRKARAPHFSRQAPWRDAKGEELGIPQRWTSASGANEDKDAN